MTLHLETLVTGSFVENGYVVWQEGSDEAVVVDPGAEPERWVAWFEDNKLVPKMVLGTHCHLDHVGAVAALQGRFDAAYRIHADEAEMCEAIPLQCRMFGHPEIPQPKVTGHVADGETFTVGGVEVNAVATPGHTPGGTCYHVPALGATGAVFTGDTLFQRSIGRTDLPGGDTDTLMASLRALCEKLPDETVVYPGHGPATTIGAEREGNPFFRA